MSWLVKLDWDETDILTPGQMSRIEANIEHILNEETTFSGNKTFTGTLTITTMNASTVTATTVNATTVNATTVNATTVDTDNFTTNILNQKTPGTFYINGVEVDEDGYIYGAVWGS